MADEAHERTDEILEKTQEKIARIYAQAYTEVQQKLEKYYDRLDVKRERKEEQLANGEITQEQFTQWLYGQMCIGERWQEMRDTLAQDLVNVNSIARSVIMESVPEVYALNHNYATFQVERDSLVDTSYTLYNRQTVEYLMRDDQILLPFPTTGSPRDKELRERADLIWNRQHLSNAITQGVLQGESIPQISKRLEKVVGMDKVAATRNARTMMTGAQNKGRQDAYDDLKSKGIELAEKWLATLDHVTRHSHRDLHGEYKDPKTGVFSNGLEYPGDPFGAPEEVYNCRCTMIAEVEGFSIETPKTSPKLGDMSFDEWVGEHEKRETVEDTQNTTTNVEPVEQQRQQWISAIMDAAPQKQLTDEQLQELQEILGGMRDEHLYLYSEMVQMQGDNRYHYTDQGAHYSPSLKRVNMDINSRYWEECMNKYKTPAGAWNTKFHEEMHQLDHILGRMYSKTAYASISAGKSDVFDKETEMGARMLVALKTDITNVINKSVAYFNREYADEIKDGLFDPAKEIKDLDKNIPRMTKQAFFEYLKTQSLGSNYRETRKNHALMSGFTDAVGLMTGGRINPYGAGEGYWGHNLKYQRERGQNGATSEAFAEIGSALMRNDKEYLDELRHWMPETVKAYDESILEIVDYVRKNGLTYEKQW